jgi:3,2-trans-enoyl-CoA isomerase
MITIIDHDQVRELRLSRPPVNALNQELLRRLVDAVEAAPADGTRAVVLSGSPGMFSGGLDVPALLTLERADMEAAWSTFVDAMRALAASPIPVAAAITGHSPAGGLVLALFCDWRVMARGEFKIGLNEVAVGITQPERIWVALRRLVGPHRAERLVVAGSMIGPEAAFEIGLVDELAEVDTVVDRAVEWCRQLTALPPNAMAATRAMARADLVALFDDVDRDAISAELDRCWYTDDAQITLSALAARLKK